MSYQWRRFAVVAAGAVVGLYSSVRLEAQTVTGRVVLRDSTTVVRGVIVEATDANTKTVIRGLTNTNGSFSLSLQSAGRYSLRVLRIGYRPTIGPTVSVAARDTARVTIVFGGEAVALPSVAIRERETCRVDADSGLVVARLWEEARKAMLTTQLTSSAPLFGEWIEYNRILDSTSRFVREQRIRTSRAPTTHAFRSRSAELLDSLGYVIGGNMGAEFFAPDADVLLSERFAAAHCFRVIANRPGQSGLIGVGFVPARDRSDHKDINGTLWIDRKSSELRSLEFQYTNLSDVAESASPGGRVEFMRLDDGNWLITAWSLRMPQLAPVRRTIRSASTTYVQAIQVTGGQVARVTRNDSALYEWRGPRVVAQVRSLDAAVSTAGATLSLDGTDYSGVADSTGRVVLSPVLEGRYRGAIRTGAMDSLGIPGIPVDVETHTDARVDTLTLPRASELLSKVCPRDSVEHGEGVLFGTVRNERAQVIDHAVVTATWQANFDIIGAAAGDQVRFTERTVGAYSDVKGKWTLCGVPRDRPVVVAALSDSGNDVRNVRAANAFEAVDIVVRHDVMVSDAIPKRKSEARALVEFVVFNLQGGPLSDARLDIRLPSGVTRTVVTGTSGRALLPDVAPGVLTIDARHIGLKPGRVAATIESGRNTVPIILSERITPVLDTMRVVGGRSVVARLDEFETRRANRLATVSFTHEEIRKRNPVDAWQMLTGVPSLRVVDSGMITVESTRSYEVTSDLSLRKCYLTVMIDGMIMNPSGSDAAFDLRQLPKPEEIHGIEVFAGPASIPVQYTGTGKGKWCGLIAFWTR